MTAEASGQRLMCVWETVAMLDPGYSASKSTARKLQVQEVTRNLSRICPSVNYSDRVFMDNFPNANVDFSDYVNYVKVCLRDHCVPISTVEDEFEINCWEMCKDCYSLHHCTMKECEVFKMWQIFNRLSVQGTIPPVMDYEDVQWLGQTFAKGAKQRWSAFHDGQLTFMEVLLDLDAVCFKMLNHRDVERVVDTVHGWLVREICITGWMSKRTRKQANWTPWRKRWFVLRPGVLSYYTTPTLAEKKGDIILTTRSRVDNLDDLKTLIRHYPNRFRITNAPFIEIELSNDEFAGKDAWMRSVKMTIKAVKAAVSPSEYMLSDIRKSQRGERLSDEDTGRLRINTMSRRARSDGLDNSESEDEIDCGRFSTASGTIGNFDDDSDYDQDRVERTSEEGTWIIPVVISKVIEIAHRLSGDESCDLGESEFKEFLKELGINLSEEEEQNLFEELNSDGSVHSKVFLEYLLKVLLFAKTPEDAMSANFFIACIKAYGNNAKLNLQAFTEALWRKQRTHIVHQMMSVMESQDGQSDNTLTELRNAFSREQSVLGTAINEKEPKHEQLEQLLQKVTHLNVEQLAQYLHMNWTIYPIKTDATECKPQRVPHEKTLLDIVFHSDQEVEADPPETTRVEMFTWKRSSKHGKSGQALLPADFDGKVVTAEPNLESLSYYGACTVTDNDQFHASLLYEHNILHYMEPEDDQDFSLCLIRLDVPSLYCPLEDNSGLLLLGKLEGQTMDLNAFAIPKYKTVYLPSGTIFCTNYMVGMWRTMVIQRSISEIALVAQLDEEGAVKNRSHKFFSFA